MSAKMGRPKVPKGKQKIPFPIRFTRDDVASFKKAARREKMTPAEWATAVLTKAAKQT